MGYRKETRQVLIGVVVGATCDNCGKELESVFGEWAGPQAVDALDITLEGGWRQYIDLAMWGNTKVELVFCKDCADRLLEQFPCFKKAIEEYR